MVAHMLLGLEVTESRCTHEEYPEWMLALQQSTDPLDKDQDLAGSLGWNRMNLPLLCP